MCTDEGVGGKHESVRLNAPGNIYWAPEDVDVCEGM